MKKNLQLFLVLAVLFVSQRSFSQTSSFYIDSASTCFFHKPYIYFVNGKSIIKSDYYGNIYWNKHVDQINPAVYFGGLEFSDDAIYGWQYDSILFKLDTAGNLLWARSFQTLLAPSTSAVQQITMVTAIDNALIVAVTEHDVSNYNAINAHFRLDTSGAITNQYSYQPSFSLFDIEMMKGVRSLQGGAWIASENASMSAKDPVIQRFGNLGQPVSTVVPAMGAAMIVTPQNFIFLPDSSYLVSIWVENYNGTQYQQLIRFNEAGGVIWNKFFEYPYGNFSSAGGLDLTADSSGNIYFLGAFQDFSFSPYWRPIIFKLDGAGNIRWNKSWSNQIILQDHIDFSKIDFANDSLYIYYNKNSIGGIASFDTSMSGPCLAPDTIMSVNISSQIGISFPFNYGGFNYTPSVAPAAQTLSQTLPPVSTSCIISKTSEINDVSDYTIFPVPVTENKLFINGSVDEKTSATIISLTGQELAYYQLKSGQSKNEIQLPILSPGIYFLKIQSDRSCKTMKFTVN